MKKVLGSQGEITFFLVEGDMPEDVKPHKEIDRHGRPIISHSESGSHHVLDRAVSVMEKQNVPGGMRIFYALLEEPAELIQDASDAHGTHILPAGLIEFRIAREIDHFTRQIRQVAD